jgi:acyl carrier protein
MKDNGIGSHEAAASADLRGKLLEIFADIFQIEIAADAGDLGRHEIEAWDSVNHLRLITEIEERFAVALSDEEVTTIACLRDLEKLLIGRGPGNLSG